MIHMNSPCYGCDERHEACHGHCEKYKAFQAKLDAIRYHKRLEQQVEEAEISNHYRMAEATRQGQTKHVSSYYYHKYK